MPPISRKHDLPSKTRHAVPRLSRDVGPVVARQAERHGCIAECQRQSLESGLDMCAKQFQLAWKAPPSKGQPLRRHCCSSIFYPQMFLVT